MNAWIVRVLGGAACTTAALAFGVGVAQAQEQHNGPTDVQAVVSVVTGSHHHSGTSAGNRVAVTAKSVTPASAERVGTTHQVRVIARTTVGGQQSMAVRPAPSTNPRPVRDDTLVAAVTDADAAACVRINAGDCGSTTGAGTGPVNSGTQVAADSAGVGGINALGFGSNPNGHTLQGDGAPNGTVTLTGDAGSHGNDPSLAHTGAGDGLLPTLLVGLAALLASGPLLRRRRNG